MKLDGATIPIEQRSAAACLDLATVFCHHHAPQMLSLSALFGVPACLLVRWLELSLSGSLCVFFMLSPFLGAVVVCGAGIRVFGDPFSLRVAFRMLRKRLLGVGLLFLLTRLVIFVCGLLFVLPGLLIAVRYGFLTEVALLERLKGSRLERRFRDVVSGAFMELFGGLLWIMVFYAAVVVSLFLLVDIGSYVLFDFPIFFGRVPWDAPQAGALALLSSDPLTILVLNGTMWLAYPLARVAWFFCYLDVRIRKECWDIELDFRVEANRLQAVNP